MKHYYLIFLIFISCSSKPENSNNQSKDSPVGSEVQTQNNTCSIESYLNNPEIIDEAKQMWKGELKITDDKNIEKILSQLIGADIDNLPFYILVVDKINRKADGGLAELTMPNNYEFINQRTEDFFNLFNQPQCLLKEHQLNYPSSFAQQYANYLSMKCDNGDYKNCILKELSILEKKCTNCDMKWFLSSVKRNTYI